MTDDELKAVTDAEAAMTPAPWEEVVSGRTVTIVGGDDDQVIDADCWVSASDLDGVIALRNAAPRLLATIAQQRAMIATLRAALSEYADDDNWDGFNNWTGRHTARDALAAVAAMEGDDHAT